MRINTIENCEFDLIIADDDLNTFMKNYIKMNPSEFEECSSEEEALDKMRNLIRRNVEFTGSSEGYTFNAWFFKDVDSRYEYAVIISSDKPITSKCFFSDAFYSSLDEAEAEFKEKVGKYLSDDFDYRAHIECYFCKSAL